MDLVTLTENQQAVCELAESFAKKEILPHAKTYDQKGTFPLDIHKKATDAGLLNLAIEEKYGGAGLGHLEFAMVTEKMAWACVGIAGAISLNSMIADVLMTGGNEKQRVDYLGRIVKGEVGGYAMTEPQAGSNVAGIQSTAIKKGSKYILNGSKTWISNAPVASFFIVFAKTDPTAAHKGISAFLVERDTPGLKIGNNLPKLGQKAFPAAELFFDNAEVSEAQMLGREGEGFLIAMKVFDKSRPMVASLGVGLSQRCLDESLNYAKTRQSMGKPIISHQMIAQKIAEMGMRTQAARLLTYQASDYLDKDRQSTLASSYAKTFASDTAAWAASEAVQIFGGMGYSTEYPVEKFYRDAKVLQIYEGTNEIQRLIMARELAK
jgi:acyl-CoA dehydrogenase